MASGGVLKNGDVITLSSQGLHGSRGQSLVWADDFGQLHLDPHPKGPLDLRYKFAVYKFLPQRSGGNQDPVIIHEGDNFFIKSLYTGKIGQMHSFDCGWDLFRFNMGAWFALGDYLGSGEGSFTSFSFMSPEGGNKGKPVKTDGSIPYAFMNTGRSCFASARHPTNMSTAASANVREMFRLHHAGEAYHGAKLGQSYYMGADGQGQVAEAYKGEEAMQVAKAGAAAASCPPSGYSTTDIVLTVVGVSVIAGIIGWAVYETVRKNKKQSTYQ